MMQLNVEQISATIQQFFDDHVESMARKMGFVQRESKLNGQKFLEAIVFGTLEKREMTLTGLAQVCLDVDVEITEQGLDSRINRGSAAFLKEMWTLALEKFRATEPLDINLLTQFTNVYLIDSSQISLPETMSELFPGSGGNASTASLKVQLVFDYLHGQFEQLELAHGREPDQGYRGHWDMIKEDALYIMDLGYYVLDSFRAISAQGGYFLSRLQAQTALMDESGERIALTNLLADQSESVAEYTVRIGSRLRHRIPGRLITVRLAQDVADRRRQKAKANAQRHGRTVSKEWLKLLDWALFITNVPSPMLQMEHVATLYRIRWQIELVFKMCKSFCGLDYIASLRPERIMTEFYARLIGVLLTFFLIAPVRLPCGRQLDREISYFKVRSMIERFARSLLTALWASDTFVEHIRSLYRHVGHFGFKQKRRKSPNSVRLLTLISEQYDWKSDPFDINMKLDIRLA